MCDDSSKTLKNILSGGIKKALSMQPSVWEASVGAGEFTDLKFGHSAAQIFAQQLPEGPLCIPFFTVQQSPYLISPRRWQAAAAFPGAPRELVPCCGSRHTAALPPSISHPPKPRTTLAAAERPFLSSCWFEVL